MSYRSQIQVIYCKSRYFIFHRELWGWESGHHHFVITFQHFKQRWHKRYRFKQRDDVWGGEGGVICSFWPCLSIRDAVLHISICLVIIPSVSTPPCFAYQTFFCHTVLLSFCNHLSVPVWIPFHLIVTSQTLTLHYPSPPPPPIHPILLLLAWLIAETGPILCRAACKVSPATTTVSPPLASPPTRIDYPTLQGDNQWAWPDFETWWVRACV